VGPKRNAVTRAATGRAGVEEADSMIDAPRVATREDWLRARRALLEKEKAHLRAGDAIAAERRALPWVRVEARYRFETETGPRSLAELFGGRSQLVVYHFMFGPGWKQGCDGCSFLADHFDGANLHLQHHDVSLVAVSRAPLAEFLPYKRRMGWHFPWVSSHGSTFNADFFVSARGDETGERDAGFTRVHLGSGEGHGISVFARATDGAVFHTYSTYGRGCDPLIDAHALLDLTPLGRNERGVMDWVRRHDEYADG
jgi:predicted dithiol-disulfide oxidoreductase (DUF899 family)